MIASSVHHPSAAVIYHPSDCIGLSAAGENFEINVEYIVIRIFSSDP